MERGRIEYLARVTDRKISFARIRITPRLDSIQYIEIENQTGSEVCGVVEIVGVASSAVGFGIANRAIESTLNRLSFFYSTVIESPRVIASQFESMEPSSGLGVTAGTGYYHFTGNPVDLVRGVSPSALKIKLEQDVLPGESSFGMFRSALRSVGPVEEFMHLYSILLNLYDDKQVRVDAFIACVEPNVELSQVPDKKLGKVETIYTRLRNELAHKRKGVQIEETKQSMSNQLGGLRDIIKKAIESNP